VLDLRRLVAHAVIVPVVSAVGVVAPGAAAARVAAGTGSYVLKTWRTLATVNGGQGTTDRLQFPGAQASFVRLEIDSASTSTPPMLEELTATG
jgi:hypothetical protein